MREQYAPLRAQWRLVEVMLLMDGHHVDGHHARAEVVAPAPAQTHWILRMNGEVIVPWPMRLQSQTRPRIKRAHWPLVNEEQRRRLWQITVFTHLALVRHQRCLLPPYL